MSALRGWGRAIKCALGFHDMAASCEGYEASGPPPGHELRPAAGDSTDALVAKFTAWTTPVCNGCGMRWDRR